MYKNCMNLHKVYQIKVVDNQLWVKAYGLDFAVIGKFTKKDFENLQNGMVDIYLDISGEKQKLIWKS